MVGVLGSVCSVSWHVGVSVCSGVSSVWRSFISLWFLVFFHFLSASTNLPNRRKKTGIGETPTKWRISLETWVQFCDPSLHKFWLLLKLNIVPGWGRSLDGTSSPAVSCLFCGVWGFLSWSLWQEWFKVFPAAHLIVLAKQKQLCVVVWERKWGAGEGESTFSQCWH